VALLKIQRRMDPTLVFMVSGRLDVENVGELCHLIDAEPLSGAAAGNMNRPQAMTMTMRDALIHAFLLDRSLAA
jgi:hypothetical protein